MESRKFTHVGNFTGYMDIVARHFAAHGKPVRILDLPAGNGLLSDAFRAMGHEVVSADINRERPDYVYVDMARHLPFSNGQFDAAVCLEGLEHLVNPVQLIAELCRVVRAGGQIVVSTPNVMNFYSRLHFLFTGVPYQFNPAAVSEVAPGISADRGHVFPLSYFQLRYLFEQHGAGVAHVLGDRYKRKALMPVYLALLPFAWVWSRLLFRRQGDARYPGRNQDLMAASLSGPLLFSRSLVLVLEKRATDA